MDAAHNSDLSAAMAAVHRGRRVLSAPAVCPLERAFGRHLGCRADGCIFYRVPEVVTDCAIQHWAPSVSRQPALAAWFLARRDEGAQPAVRKNIR